MKDLQTVTLAELRQMAKDLGIKGWWKLNKTQVLEAIQNAQEDVEPEAQTNTKAVEEDVPEVVQEGQKKNQKRLITYEGKTQTLTAWARELGIRHQTLYNRIVMKGWDVEKAFGKSTKKVEKVPGKG